MQPIAIFNEIVAVIDVEMIVFLVSLGLYFMLKAARTSQLKMKRELKVKCVPCPPKPQNEGDSKEGQGSTQDDLNARFAEIEKNMHSAFESEDLWQALRCWYAMKKFKNCTPRYLPQIIKTMQSTNKTDDFIVTELRDYLWKHPRQRIPAVLNDVLDPLARQLDYSELVNAIVIMAATLNIKKDERTYEILLTMYVAKQEATKAQELMAEMTTKNVDFTPCALVAVMTMALQLGKLDVALKAFRKLKLSWDVRSTWAVSPFALQRHKANAVLKVVELACGKNRLAEILPLLEDMTVSDEVMSLVGKKCASLNDIEVAAMCKVLGNGSKFMKCLDARSKALLRARQAKVDSDASTSEGSRSDSEDDSPLQVSCRA